LSTVGQQETNLRILREEAIKSCQHYLVISVAPGQQQKAFV
jgi:hypothetical protein